MATQKEMMMDAAANTETAATMSAGDTFEGTLSSKSDEDWIRIEMTAGMLYTINLSGRETDNDGTTTTAVADTFLKLYDSKGGFIKQNDDIEGEKGDLNSMFQFVPLESGVYYISAGAYTRNLGQKNEGGYTVTVTEMVAGLPDPIEGTGKADKLRGTERGEKITGREGDDSLIGLGGDDTLDGGMGSDLLVGGMGADTLIAGPDPDNPDSDNPVTDTISYNTSPAGVTVNLTDGTARGGDADGDTIVDGAARGRFENVIGSNYDDVLTGNDLMNRLQGLGGDDVLDGGEADDVLEGGEGDDTLDGGDEDDTLVGGPGADTLIGGEGADTASYADSTMGVHVRLHSNKLDGGDAKGDVFADTATHTYVVQPDPEEADTEEVTETLPDIINLTGSGMADVLAGDSRDNEIMGGGGDDVIFGGPGGSTDDSDNDDTLMGEGGNDKIYGGKGGDTLDGGAGDDLLVGGSGGDTFIGGPGSDMIYADRVDLSSTINGHTDDEKAPEKMPGEQDTLSFAKFMDPELEDGTGITLDLDDVTNIDHLIGTAEVDYLTGRNATEEGPAPEIIEGGDGGDELDGGTGPDDTVSYAGSDGGVDVELGNGTTDDNIGSETSGSHARRDIISEFENVMGSAYDDELVGRTNDTDTVTEGIQGSMLWGLGGDDALEGSIGNDTLEGGAGADELNGGDTPAEASDTDAGFMLGQSKEVNTLSYAGSDAGVRVDLATASASGGHADGDEIATYDLTLNAGEEDEDEIEVATFVNVTGSDHNDHLTGDMFGNSLSGGGGDDNLRGAAGADTLTGGPGADMLDGGEDTGEKDNKVPDGPDSDDELDDASEDWAVYRDAGAGADGTGVTVDLHAGSGTAGEAEGDTLRNIELIWGSKHNDTFIASAGHDIIHGDGGSDTVSYEESRHGVTVILPTTRDDDTQFAFGPDGTAGTEDDTFTDATPEIVADWRGDNSTTARPGAVQAEDYRTTTKSYAEGDVLASIENVTGSRRADVITGDGVPNVLKGGAGDDELAGQGGNDTLYGGDGNDTLGRTSGTPARPAEDLNGDGVEDPGEEAVEAVPEITNDASDDTMHGGHGNDTLYGGAGADILNGGPGDDDLQGDVALETNTHADVFVFTPDGPGSDVILDFSNTDGVAITNGDENTTNGDGDKIDLSAFNIDPSDLAGLLSERAGSVILNLEDYGGGRVTIQGGVTLEGLMEDADGNHLIHIDVNGDTTGVGETVDGVTGNDGVFIL